MAILVALVNKRRETTLEELAEETRTTISSIASLVELLKSRGIVEVYEREVTYAKTSDEGRKYLDKLPEEMLAEILVNMGGEADVQTIESLLGKDTASIALGWARRRGWVEIDRDRRTVRLVRYEQLLEHRKMLGRFLGESEVPSDVKDGDVFSELVKRKLLNIYKRKIKLVKLAVPVEKALEIINIGEGISRITREVIVKELWRTSIIKPYNVSALPPVRYAGKKHFFKEFVKMIEEIMESLGFEKVDDDYVIPELWNFDILFQAQDHPSRDIHDILVVEGEADLSIFSDVISRVKDVHERGGGTGSTGWGYTWSLEKASKLILRSHTTAVTARSLIGREPSARLYAVARVFRRDNPDARHSPEFTNFDGVVMENDFNFRKLLGLLSQILRRLGIEKVMFKPAYFPFTEPSVEGYGYVRGYGWIEIFGAGMFRPEVLNMIGAKAPVGAWGMGVERLAMVVYGIDDIRLLFSKDVEFIRRFPLLRSTTSLLG